MLIVTNLKLGADSYHSGPAHCHPKADSASIGNTSAPEHAIASSSGSSYRRDSWAIISTESLHVSKEVPLPPYFSIAFVTLRTMFSLVGGRVEKVSIVNNAKLF